MLPVGISAGYANFYFESETIELFIEDQALSPSYDLAPPPPRRPPSVNSSRPATHRKTERDNLLADGRSGRGEGAKSYEGEKAWSCINHSINTLWFKSNLPVALDLQCVHMVVVHVSVT